MVRAGICAVQFVFAVDTVPHTVTKNVTVHAVSLVEVGTLELAHFAYVFTALFVTSVPTVYMVVAAIFLLDTVPGAVTCEFVVLANCTVFTHAVELAIQTGTVETVLGNDSALGPLLSVVETGTVFCQNAPVVFLYVSLGTEAPLHALRVVTVGLGLVPNVSTGLGAGRGAGGVAEAVLTHDGTDFLASPFYRISGLITALGEVGDSSTETLAVSPAVTSAGVKQAVGMVTSDDCICEELPAGFEDVAEDNSTGFLGPLFSV